MTPSTVSRTEAITLKAPSNTGARSSQKPFQIFLMVSTMSPKSMPRAESLSRMPSTKFDTASLIRCQVPRIASRNLSFVFHRCTKAATRMAITATTASTGAEMPPRAAPSFPMIPVPALMAVFILPTAPASFTKPCMATPILEMVVPMITRSGAIAATKSAIRMMTFRWLSSMPFSLSTKA